MVPNRPPGPPYTPLVGHISKWRKDPVKLMIESSRHGDVVRLRLPGETYLLNHPAHVKHVLQDNYQNYCKGWVFDRLKPYFGESLITAEGETWRQQRRRVQPSFKHEHSIEFAPTITKRTGELLMRWERSADSGEELVAYTEMTQLALVIIGDVLFGAELSSDASAMVGAVQTALRVIKARVAALAPLPLWVPTPANLRFRRAMSTLHDGITRISELHRAAARPDNGFFARLMEARDSETGERMSDKQLHEEAIGMLQLGHDTIGETLAWIWYLLSLHPDVERKLHAEVTSVLGDRTPRVEDLERLTYARLIVHECLRLFPPVWVVPRDAINDDEIGGYRIPAGSTILLCPYLTHRHPAFWQNPEGFDPERFLPEHAAGRPRHAYFPFGGGPRMCMGADIAMMEILLILSMIVRKYRLHLVSGHHEEAECILDMIPRFGVRVTLQRQSSIGRPALAT